MRSHRTPWTLPLLAAFAFVALAPYCAPPIACPLMKTDTGVRAPGCCPLNVSCCPPLRAIPAAAEMSSPKLAAPIERIDLALADVAVSTRPAIASSPAAVARAPGLPTVLRI